MPGNDKKIVIPETMRGIMLERTGQPLVMRTLPVPQPAAHQVLAKVIAAAHILVQLAIYQHKRIFAFPREGDAEAQNFAMKLGAVWAGDSAQSPQEKMDAAIIFAPAGNLIPKALQDVDKGGVVVCGGIHMSDIPSFPYRILWEERVLRSVANLTRRNGEEFLKLASQVPIRTETQAYPLHNANDALNDLRNGKIHGAAMLVIDDNY